MFPYHLLEHTNIDLTVAEYLHTQGITQNPEAEQTTGNLPAIFCAIMPDTPDHAVLVTTLTIEEGAEEGNPVVTFMIMVRTQPWKRQQLADTMGTIFSTLNDRLHIPLTATQHALVCQRIAQNPLFQDHNQRWIRSDTYRMRLAVPTPGKDT